MEGTCKPYCSSKATQKGKEIADFYLCPDSIDHTTIWEEIAVAIQDAVVAERERCAKIADEVESMNGGWGVDDFYQGKEMAARNIAELIREGIKEDGHGE